MSHWIIIITSTLAISYGMLHGFLMLISPETHRRFNLRINDPFGRFALRRSKPDGERGLELEYRFAGLAILGMCIFLAWLGFDVLQGYSSGRLR